MTAATLDAAAVTARMRAAHARDVRRAGLALILLTLAILTGLAGTLALGVRDVIPLSQLPAAVIGRGDDLADFVVIDALLPRALGAALAGLLFGVSGILYQRTVRNALATPDIIGITAGASLGAVCVIVLTPAGRPGIQIAALTGAMAAVVGVVLLSWRQGLSTYRLILVGIGVSAVAAAATNYILLRANLAATAAALRWTTGSTNGLMWSDVHLLLLVTAAALICVTPLSRGLTTMRVGDDFARGLGTRVTLVRLATLGAGAITIALVTSVTGPIAFVALVSGPIVTRLVPRGPHLLLTALFGALLVTLADLIAQFGPLISPIPVGVITAIIGAPVLLWLLLGRRDVMS